MFNPFEQEPSEHSREATTLPVSMRSDQYTASPISFLQMQRQELFPEVSDLDAGPDKKYQQFMREVKGYAESLEKRNLEMACELQKERNKNKQLMTALSFLMSAEEERNKSLQVRLGQLSENSSKLEIEQNRREMIESEVKSLRLQNGYMKDLILIANDNYEKLQQKNRQLLEKHSQIEQQSQQRQLNMLRKTEQIKNMFTAMVVERESSQRCEGNMQIAQTKQHKKQQAEEAYRSIFMRTLKARKQNINKQN